MAGMACGARAGSSINSGLPRPSDAAAVYTLTLPFDALFELRAHAARRLWRTLNDRSPGGPFRAMPDQLREFHILTLRALDARQCGESYRTIAEALLGFHRTQTDWEGDPRKNKARRLVASGRAHDAGRLPNAAPLPDQAAPPLAPR